LSNATKNQKDVLSSIFQSYAFTFHSFLIYSYITILFKLDVVELLLGGAFTLLLFIDFCTGIEILL
jgi:hypothetical protein